MCRKGINALCHRSKLSPLERKDVQISLQKRPISLRFYLERATVVWIGYAS